MVVSDRCWVVDTAHTTPTLLGRALKCTQLLLRLARSVSLAAHAATQDSATCTSHLKNHVCLKCVVEPARRRPCGHAKRRALSHCGPQPSARTCSGTKRKAKDPHACAHERHVSGK